MERFLTYILSRAVPEVHVERVKISYWSMDRTYFISVYPSQMKYWLCFRKKYPHWRQVALKYTMEEQVVSEFCPEFFTQKGLLDWLADTLGLSRGERNLLRLSVCRGETN